MREVAEVFPIGKFIKEELDARDRTYKYLALKMDMTEKEVKFDLIYRTEPLTYLLAAKLGEVFNTSPLYWLDLDKAFWKSLKDNFLKEGRSEQ